MKGVERYVVVHSDGKTDREIVADEMY
jgi:hypothetical protein